MEITMEMETGIKEPDLTPREVVETCPHCECENILHWDPLIQGYMITCWQCGKKMMLCDECMHADDNQCQRCDWHMVGDKHQKMSVCFRGAHRF